MTSLPLLPSTLADALLAFMQAELQSPSEGPRMDEALASQGLSATVLMDNDADESLLWSIFMAYRGRETLFATLDLRALRWHRTGLSFEDLQHRVRTCRHGYENSRKLMHLLEVLDHQARTISILGRAERETLPPPLLVSDPSMSQLVILEGHNRLLAFASAPDQVVFPLPVLLGISEAVPQWREW